LALEVLVTGAAGVLGGQIARSLERAGNTVIRSGRISHETNEVVWDISQDAGPNEYCQPEVVVHAAAHVGQYQQPIAESEELFQVNIGGTARVADWCVSQGVKRLVLISGAIVYGRWSGIPKSEADQEDAWAAGPYSVSKLCAEKVASLVLNHKIELCILRLSSLYGPGYKNGLPQRLIGEGRENGVISLSPPFDDGFDLLHISDAAETVANAVALNGSGVWNVGSGQVTVIQDLAQACADSVDARLEFSQRGSSRAPRIINWVNDQKARRDMGHTNKVSLQVGIRDLESDQSGRVSQI